MTVILNSNFRRTSTHQSILSMCAAKKTKLILRGSYYVQTINLFEFFKGRRICIQTYSRSKSSPHPCRLIPGGAAGPARPATCRPSISKDVLLKKATYM